MENAEDMQDGMPKQDPAQAAEVTEYDQGDEILREGEASPYFLVILSGRVRISHSGRKIRILGEQDIFSLENLILNKPSDYSATALDKCRIAKYGPEALDHIIRKNPRMVGSLLKSTLNQLAQTTHAAVDRQESLDEGTVKFYGDGEIVIGPNSRGMEIYRLVSTQGGLQVRMGGKQFTRIDRPGAFFGHLAGLFQVPRQSTVVSVGESVVEIYDHDDLDMLIRDYPDAARRIMQAIMLRFAKISRKQSGAELVSDSL